MNIHDDSSAWAVEKFAIGQPVPRKEDPTLIQGRGRYTDDVTLPNLAHAVIVRSRHAHGKIKKIDVSAAKKMPGVLAVYTGADIIAAGYGVLKTVMPLKNRDGSTMQIPVRYALATDKVRFVGDPVACVIAETINQGKDAAEAVELDIEPLPAVTSARDSAKDGAPQLYDDKPGNIAADWHFGDSEKVTAAFKSAAHVVKMPLRNTRVVVASMEPRGFVASYDKATERFTVYTGGQSAFGQKMATAEVLKVPPEKVHAILGNTGGSFGMKAPVFPEYICVSHATRDLGRPVKWIDERTTAFLSDTHGRDHDQVIELALDKDGHFLAVRTTGYGNSGAYVSMMGTMQPTMTTMKNTIGVYRTPLIEQSTKLVFTNTTPIAPYRGAGRPEGNYYMERLIDQAAREMGIDRVEIRKRNHIKPKELPYKTPSDNTYDSGNFPALFKRAIELGDIKGFSKRKRESKKRGKLRGLGFGSFLEQTAPMAKELGGIRFEKDGTVTIVTGTYDFGQGHASSFAQVLATKLGVPFDRIRLMQGDSDQLPLGGGTGGSKSAMMSGNAVAEGSAKVIEQGKQIAAFVLEASAGDIEFKPGRFTIAGTDRSIGIMDLADKINAGLKIPAELPQSLSVQHVSDGVPATFPNGAHLAEVEIDEDTGVVEVVKYIAINDLGTELNPLLVAGQVHGGLVQGIGQV
ncbi:MAG TPA: xanthine dehydrogenase family protein molybdopterin-binding subunit, partial [Xanthobacteraceae bacterium]|nr:xanthine dehydrogenase family protein molybdopterin-binding subunit [Xanthobacteraceae bacterium]